MTPCARIGSWPSAALRHRNYRLFFVGQGISPDRHLDDQIATGWLVYRLTNSAFLLGVVDLRPDSPFLLVAGVWSTAGTGTACSWPRRLCDDPVIRTGGAGASAGASASGRSSCSACCRASSTPSTCRRGRLRDRDGRRPRGPAQRHRAELVDGQRGAAAGSRDRRYRDRERRAKATASSSTASATWP